MGAGCEVSTGTTRNRLLLLTLETFGPCRTLGLSELIKVFIVARDGVVPAVVTLFRVNNVIKRFKCLPKQATYHNEPNTTKVSQSRRIAYLR